MTSENRPTAEECKEVLGFDHISEKFRVITFSDHPEGLYELNPTRAAFILKHLNKDNRKIKPSQTKEINGSIEEDGWQDDGDTVVTLRRNMTFKALKQAIFKWRG